jgi:hypothetical protein
MLSRRTFDQSSESWGLTGIVTGVTWNTTIRGGLEGLNAVDAFLSIHGTTPSSSDHALNARFSSLASTYRQQQRRDLRVRQVGATGVRDRLRRRRAGR